MMSHLPRFKSHDSPLETAAERVDDAFRGQTMRLLRLTGKLLQTPLAKVKIYAGHPNTGAPGYTEVSRHSAKWSYSQWDAIGPNLATFCTIVTSPSRFADCRSAPARYSDEHTCILVVNLYPSSNLSAHEQIELLETIYSTAEDLGCPRDVAADALRPLLAVCT